VSKEREETLRYLERKHAYATDKSNIVKRKLTRLPELHLQDTGLRMHGRLSTHQH
jgi:hypothetical protein